MKKDRFRVIVAVYLILRQNDSILLARRANTGYADGLYSLPAGHLEGDELATEGMAREAKEELGIMVRPEDMMLVHTAHRLNRNEANQERIDLFFETTQWSGMVTNAEPHKCDDVSWFASDSLPENTLPLIRRVFDAVARGDAFSEFTHDPN